MKTEYREIGINEDINDYVSGKLVYDSLKDKDKAFIIEKLYKRIQILNKKNSSNFDLGLLLGIALCIAVIILSFLIRLFILLQLI